MNYGELKTAILSDSHREDYGLIPGLIQRFVTEAEALIAARLESYALTAVLNDAARVSLLSSDYTLPSKLILVRFLIGANGLPLEAVDETSIGLHKSASTVMEYAVRPATIILAGTPGAGSVFTLHYFGLPAALAADPDTNSLLNDYPQLYKEAGMVSVFKRAHDYESAQVMYQSANSLIDEINRKMKKLLGGAKAANPYNVSFRSSY